MSDVFVITSTGIMEDEGRGPCAPVLDPNFNVSTLEIDIVLPHPAEITCKDGRNHHVLVEGPSTLGAIHKVLVRKNNMANADGVR